MDQDVREPTVSKGEGVYPAFPAEVQSSAIRWSIQDSIKQPECIVKPVSKGEETHPHCIDPLLPVLMSCN